MDKEFEDLLVKACPDEITARLAVKILNLKQSNVGKSIDKDIRKLIAQSAAKL